MTEGHKKEQDKYLDEHKDDLVKLQKDLIEAKAKATTQRQKDTFDYRLRCVDGLLSGDTQDHKKAN